MFEEKGVGGTPGDDTHRVLPDLFDPGSLDDPAVLAALAARWCDHDDPPDLVDGGDPRGWAGPADPWPDGWLTPPPGLPGGMVAALDPGLDPGVVAASFRPHGAVSGTTTDTNLYTGCLHDHRVKDRPGWSVRQTPHGRVEWTTPTGHRYSSDPHDYRPDNDPDPPLLRHPPAREPVPEDLPHTDGRTSELDTGQQPDTDTSPDQDTGTGGSWRDDVGAEAGENVGRQKRSPKRWRPIRRFDNTTTFGPPGDPPTSSSEDDLDSPPPF